ncbi:MAG: SRPBCC domain-containing protein [Planctomycetes bacterium]|nr:SRPBCC domain-containing protein [Planctomycetota bacterium]
MVRQEDDGSWVVLQETIACHHDEVFTCLTTAEGLSRWFPVAARVELHKGGRIVLSWNRDFTRTTTVAILEYDAGGKIVWDWQAAHSEMHAPVYWSVQPDREQGSQIQLRQGPFRSDAESLLVLAQEAVSWRWHLCNLRCVLEVGHDMRAVRPL